MTTLSDLLKRARETREGRRARRLALEDLQMMQALVAVRVNSGLSQEDVGQRLGLTQQAVSKFERHDSDPRLSAVRRYAGAIGALVGHVVEPDTGQLERGDWTVMAWHFPTPTSTGSQNARTYAVGGVTRSDFAEAA